MKLILVGNPNCGKSTLFNALTGAHAKTGNWHGVTVGETVREAVLCGERAEIADLPGIYCEDTYSMEEEVSRRAIQSGKYDLAVCIADALTLERSLGLLKSVLRQRKNTALVITMCDLLKKRGGHLNERALSERLGLPVLCVDAHSGKDIKKLRIFLWEHMRRKGSQIPQREIDASVLDGIYAAGTREENIFFKLFYSKYFALPLFFAAMLAVFFLAFAKNMPGVLLKDLCEVLITDICGERLALAVESTGAIVAAEFVRSLFSGTGMLLSFVPQIAILYLALFLMEESGFMSALAFMTDGLFRRVGLTGRAAFSILMGFGCSAAAILTTKGLENKQIQKRVILILPYISCSAKMPVYLTVLSAFFRHPFAAIVGVYFAGILLSFAAALVCSKLYRGEEEFVMEIAHPQIPSLRVVLKSLLFSIKQFIIKIATVVSAFLIVMWLLLSFSFSFRYVGVGSGDSMMAILCKGIRFLFYPMGITQWEIALSAVSGLIAKESVAGMLAVFYGDSIAAQMSAASAIAFVVFIMTCSPCISAIAAAAREVGLRCAVGFAAAQTGIAFLASYAVYGLLAGGAAAACALCLLILLAAAVLFLIRRFQHYEKISRTKRAKIKRFHGRNVRARFVCLFAPSSGERNKSKRKEGQRKRTLASGR